MLKILGLTNNPSNDYFKRLNSTRNKNSSTKTLKTQISSSKKELSKFANDNTAKKKSRKKNTKNSRKKNVNDYQYIQQKASAFINVPSTNNKNTKTMINNIINTNSNQKNKIKFISSICLNKNKKNINKRNSIDNQNNQTINNLTTDKRIKEVKIKSNFSMSYINLFVNKSNRNNKNMNNNTNDLQNQTTVGNNIRMSTISNVRNKKGNIFDDDNYNHNESLEKNTTIVNSMCCGVYRRKKLKIFNSCSMEKRPKIKNTIESIEIDFSPRVYINKFQPYSSPQNLYQNKKEKIIKIQKYFRKFLVRKYEKIRYENIIKGFSFMNIFIKKKFYLSFKRRVKEVKNVFYVEESQIELLNLLKAKNIHSMVDLKKYIVFLIKNNKFEMF